MDAICIDQRNIEERNDQVQMMAAVYRSAEQTYAWLGPAAEDSDYAMQNIGAMVREMDAYRKRRRDTGDDWDTHASPWAWVTTKHAPWFYPDEESVGLAMGSAGRNRFWCGVRALLKRPYWSRAWVVQEMVLSRSVVMVCGTSTVHLAMVWAVAGWLKMLKGVPRPPVVHEGLWRDISRDSGHVHLGRSEIFTSRTLRIGQLEARLPVLWRALVIETRRHMATDPRDKLYSVLGLLNIPIRPDYSLSVERLYGDLAKACLKADGRLGVMLSLAGHGLNPEVDMTTPQKAPYTLFVPTWAPNWDLLSKARMTYRLQIYLRYPERGQLVTDSTQTPCWSFEDDTFNIQGRSCDRVAMSSMVNKTESRASFCERILAKSRGPYVSGIPILQALARAIFLDRDPMTGELLGNNPDPLLILGLVSYGFAAHQPRDALQGEDPDRTLERFGFSDIGHLLRAILGHDLTPDLLERAEAWLQRLKSKLCSYRESLDISDRFRGLDGIVEGWTLELVIMQTRRLFSSNAAFMTENGRLGWGPPGMQAGDLICLLGDDLAVVLRKVDSHYLHIGVCFVLGFDYDEELEAVRKGCEVESFRIV